MKTNSNVKIHAENIYLVPYRKEHVPKYHEWMECAELREFTASEQLSLNDEFIMQETWFNDDNKCTFIILDAQTYEKSGDEVEAMIGDINIFIDETDSSRAEISVMIAEKDYRGKGRGKSAILSMLRYAIEDLNIGTFVAKIGTQNAASIHLFQSIGFKEVSRSEVFNEVVLEQVAQDCKLWLHGGPPYRKM